MNHILDDGRGRRAGPGITPLSALDTASILDAYRRWAGVYDSLFGAVSTSARRRAVDIVNRLPGRTVLEVGVGTGLALPRYTKDKRITGIDLSVEMLDIARRRVARQGLHVVQALHEMDAEATDFPDASFDTAVAMFVASVVPNPRRLLTEMRRVVKPGGNILFVNHFAAPRGPRWWIERGMAPASRALGWHPDFAVEALFAAEDLPKVTFTPAPPVGLFTLARLVNEPHPSSR